MRFLKISLILATLYLSVVDAFSQASNAPSIAYVYPAGAGRGSTVKITIGGRNLGDVKKIIFSSSKLKESKHEITVPLKRGQHAGLRNRLEEKYVKEHPEVVEEMKKYEDGGQRYLRKLIHADKAIMQKLAEADASVYLRKVSSEPMAETVEFEMTLAPDTPLGVHSISLWSEKGLSNPIRFEVSSGSEFVKPSLRDIARERIKLPKYWGKEGMRTWKNPVSYPSKRNDYCVVPPITVNGQIVEAKTDAYHFYAKKGTKLVIDVRARIMVPYISDAVPGWFQPVVRLTDSSGKEVAYSDDFYHRPDPHIIFDVKKDGMYCAEIHDSIYRSREDFTYRMTIGAVKYAESIFPLAHNKGEVGEFELTGVNLNSEKVKIKIPYTSGFITPSVDALIPHDMRIMPVAVKTVLSASESARASNEKKLSSVKLDLPVVANGRIIEKDSIDVYTFDAVQGTEYIIETFARRLGSPMDTHITISDSSGKIVARADDYEDASGGFITAHTDSRLIFKAPRTTTYMIKVCDVAGAFGKEYAYALSLSKLYSDFSLSVVPSSLNAMSGRNVSFRVYAFRNGGDDNYPIKLNIIGFPAGAILHGGEIPAGADYADVVVSIPQNTQKGISKVSVTGEAKLGKDLVWRRARPCEDMMQAFYYRHYVPFNDMNLSINTWHILGKSYNAVVLDDAKIPSVLEIEKGKNVEIDIGSVSYNKAPIPKAVFQDTPDGLAIESLENKGGRLILKITCSENAKTNKGVFMVNLLGKHWRGMFLVDKLFPVKYAIVEHKAQSKELKENTKSVANLSAK